MQTAIINIGAPLILGLDETDPSCNGLADGVLTLNNNNLASLGGTPPYDIIWSTSDIDVLQVSGLGAGNYSVAVQDANNCTVVETEGLIDPALITTSLINQTNPTCNGSGFDGSISVIGNGGTIAPGSDYTYSWTGPNSFTANTPAITGLEVGQYCVLTSDDNACVVAQECFILDPNDAPNIIDFNTTDIACAAFMNGASTVNFMPEEEQSQV